MTSKNLYHKRLVADTAAKACWVCYKPSSTVLITPESDDWFHICSGHLSDRNFAVAQDAVDPEQQKREQELEKEIEAVKKEYEEKMKKKKAKQKKDKKDDDKEDKSSDKAEDEEKEKDSKIKELEEKKTAPRDSPRIFELSRHFYQMRLQKKQQASLAKKNAERLRNPTAFPSVPSGDL